MPSLIEIVSTILFAIAITHTFSVPFFARLANRRGPHAGLWHMLAEVEAVFGVWAFVLLVVFGLLVSPSDAIAYLDSRDFTEPAFVFAIMVVAASRPILELVSHIVQILARAMPLPKPLSKFFVTMAFVPLAGSFITEPAAMTLAALLLRDNYFYKPGQAGFKYMTLGVLFVNISIGGVLTAYAAPPVLMVAQTFGWDTAYMATHFGWRAAIAVILNAAILTVICRPYLLEGVIGRGAPQAQENAENGNKPLGNTSVKQVPWPVMVLHVGFLLAIVLSSHHPFVFLGVLMMFIGYAHAYKRFQNVLLIREGLMVGFFLAGLVILGGLQKWWLQDLLGGLSPTILFWGATALTAITDNAALTYLGSLVEGTSDIWRYMLVAGAVTGGGLTVIANAPNPAGFSLLKNHFPDGAISPIYLLASAAIPTLIAATFFLF
ncbi:MAG TPA: putative Na+/H+ antiporter [Burkholderiaceae bacterium]|nr:putative Na+/H+ antiporter [Burkholderiaceae bacterium]